MQKRKNMKRYHVYLAIIFCFLMSACATNSVPEIPVTMGGQVSAISSQAVLPQVIDPVILSQIIDNLVGLWEWRSENVGGCMPCPLRIRRKNITPDGKVMLTWGSGEIKKVGDQKLIFTFHLGNGTGKIDFDIPLERSKYLYGIYTGTTRFLITYTRVD